MFNCLCLYIVVVGTQNVIDVCIEESVPRLIHTSTVDVVVGYSEIENGDESLPRPNKLIYPEYGGTKAEGEQLVIKAHGRKLKGDIKTFFKTKIIILIIIVLLRGSVQDYT